MPFVPCMVWEGSVCLCCKKTVELLHPTSFPFFETNLGKSVGCPCNRIVLWMASSCWNASPFVWLPPPLVGPEPTGRLQAWQGFGTVLVVLFGCHKIASKGGCLRPRKGWSKVTPNSMALVYGEMIVTWSSWLKEFENRCDVLEV